MAPGTDDTDATTVKQVKEMIEAGGGGADLAPINRRIDNLDSKINIVGAGAAALAALHPMDTDGKFSMAAMAKTIKAQGEEIRSLRAENAKLAERLAAIEAKLAK